MDFFDTVNERRSIRHFTDDPVSRDDIEMILKAGITAPSAGNVQPWRFVVVKSDQARARLAAALDQKWAAAAPVSIVVCVDPRPSRGRYGDRGALLYSIQDAAAATQNMLLACVACGLASCWIGAFDEDAIRTSLGIKKPITPVAILPIGYSAQASGKQARRPLSEVSAWT
ncbi:MAG: nitroreductase family protein [Coriobacteriia bacterium]|nr:nitroreductase family protein [Coriobacteriia bacterium]